MSFSSALRRRGATRLAALLACLLPFALVTGTTAQVGTVSDNALDVEQLLIGDDGRIAVFVQFDDPPGAIAYAETLRARGGPQNASARAAANSAARSAMQRARGAQASFVADLRREGIAHDELYRAVRTVNGVALRVKPSQIERLKNNPRVRRVEILYPEELNNSTSVPFIGAPSLWDNTVGLPQGSTGQGVSIGIIDTGIDYQHAQFGGSGALADYQANDRTVAAPYFPT